MYSTVLLSFLLICLACQVIKSISDEIVDDEENKEVKSEPVETNEVTPMKNQTVHWITQFGTVKDSLTEIQAIIVKDEDVTDHCRRAKRKSKNRYLMCAGSILSSIYVLTSASCVHEATHIRHNVQAPLAVLIAPLKISLQTIKVLDYRIHPLHAEDPYSPVHSKHDLAILKLACRMLPENYRRVQLPKLPMSELCFQEECSIAILRKTGRNAVVLFQSTAKHVPMERRRRRRRRRRRSIPSVFQLEDQPQPTLLRKLRKLADPPSFDTNFTRNFSKPLQMAKKLNELSDILEKPYHSSIADKRNIAVTNSENTSPKVTFFSDNNATDVVNASVSKILLDESDSLSDDEDRSNSGIKSLFVRSSDGLKGCPQTGTPVMVNGTQAAVISVSCDDRQPTALWKYTDLYDNADWITATMKDWNNCWMEAPRTSKIDRDDVLSSGGLAGGAGAGGAGMCSTCVFNFFLDNCSGGNCSSSSSSSSSSADAAATTSLVSLGIPPPTNKCSEPSENLRIDVGPVVRVQKNKESVNFTDVPRNESPNTYKLSHMSLPARREIPGVPSIATQLQQGGTASGVVEGNRTLKTYVSGKQEFYAQDTKLSETNKLGRTESKQTFDLNYYDSEKISLATKSSLPTESEIGRFNGTQESKSGKSADLRKHRGAIHERADRLWTLSANKYKVYESSADISPIMKYKVNQIHYDKADGRSVESRPSNGGALSSLKFLQFPWKRSPSYSGPLLSPNIMIPRMVRWTPFNATAVAPFDGKQSEKISERQESEGRQSYPTIDRVLRDNKQKNIEPFFQRLYEGQHPRGLAVPQ